eukprot:NODE_3012_length_994_cov_56.441270_g2517_i0.p1 GENE.NODE_3012_length_994_cov_56.441270_g2517_i0~~NODE_3012_length_994_cov_56.441270_g2517_i0.p1  ORF type:complete len:203 (+),score=56.16 NODE_3012_length_994_cov_56.441270_g2517_i0:254-862(+)
MENLLFQLKFTAKQFGKSSTKAEKDEKAERTKCKKALEKNNVESARIYAQNAIRKKNEAVNYLRLQSRIDAVASRVDTAVKMRQVTKSMVGVVKGMDKVLEAMDPEKIAKVMDSFEKQFESLDVTSDYMENAIGTTTATTTPEDEVNSLMAEIADANQLEVGGVLGKAEPGSSLPQAEAAQENQQTDDLAQRLAKLKAGSGP